MSSGDVRMRGFERRVSLDEALRVALDGMRPMPAEDVAVAACGRRVLAETATSDVDVPSFRRSAMDGYAVRGQDTFGATHYEPSKLALVGESMPGADDPPRVGPRQCVRIMTGAPVPDGADAVLPAEVARESGGDVFAEDVVTPGKNVGRVGEDVAAGDVVLEAGRFLRPQDVGLLASIGRATVKVRRRPRVRIVVSGNELLAPGERPRGHAIGDSNTPMLRALVERDGGEVEQEFRLRDDAAAVRAAFAAPGADVILSAGGTSVGREDHAPSLVRELGQLRVHGVAMRPASPSGIGRIGDAKVFLLPGNPVSCLAAYDLLAAPLLRRLAGGDPEPYAMALFHLSGRITSQVGRVDYVRVADAGPDLVEPIAVGGASILSSTTRAIGFVLVPAESEGYADGELVLVSRYDAPFVLR